MRPGMLFLIAWIGWAVSWVAAAAWSGRTEKRAATREVWLYRAIILAGAILSGHWATVALGAGRIWHVSYDGAYLLAAATFAGILFAWSARIHLGRLWSWAVTLKEGHHLVESGPYALVRHPIYTGLLGAVLATAIVQGTAPALAGFVLLAVGTWMKARVEEQFLAAELGPETYAAYRRRVPMLLPFLPHGG